MKTQKGPLFFKKIQGDIKKITMQWKPPSFLPNRIVLCYVLVAFGLGNAQQILAKPSSPAEKPYYQVYSDSIIIKPFINITSMQFNIEPKDSGTKLNYRPNMFANYGVSLAYWIFGISLSTKFSDNGKDPSLYGKSEYFDFQLNYYGQRFGADFNLAVYKGYYLDNSHGIPEITDSNPQKVLFPDLHASLININLYYIFSYERLSLSASFDQSSRQRKSAGSFLLMLSYHQMSIKNTQPIIPPSQQHIYGKIGDFTDGGFATLALLPGYTYSFVYGDWYFTPMLFLGIGLQGQGYNSPTQQTTISTAAIAFKGNLRLAAGYNGEKFFAGASFIDDFGNIENKHSNLTISAAFISFTIFTGYRF